MFNLQNWGLIRIVRLVAGGIVLWNALADHQPLLGLMGGFLVLQAIANTGCGAGGCGVAAPKQQRQEPTQESVKEIDYEKYSNAWKIGGTLLGGIGGYFYWHEVGLPDRPLSDSVAMAKHDALGRHYGLFSE